MLQMDEVIRLELRHRVQVMDISQSGALVACDTRLPVGTRAQVHWELAGLPFTAEVAVRRHHAKAAASGHLTIGAQFGLVDDRSRRHLNEFLRRGRS